MNLNMIRIGACLCGLLALGGCQTTNDNLPWGANQDPVGQQRYPGIAIEQPLQQFVAVDYPAIVVTRGDGVAPMRVQVPLRSTAYQQMSVQYQFSWFDESGRLLRDAGWRFLSLEPGLQSMLDGSATTMDAVQYRLVVRSAR